MIENGRRHEVAGEPRRRPEAAGGPLHSAAPVGYLPLLPTACIAACLAVGSMYWCATPPRAPAGVAAVRPLPPSADLFRAVPEDGPHRVRAPYPVEFEQQFPLIASAPASGTFAPAAVPVLPPAEARAEPRPEERAMPHRAIPKRPRTLAEMAELRPPPRPGDLGRQEAPPVPSPAPAGENPNGPATLAGLDLPGFAPVRRTVAEAVTMASEGLTEAGTRVLGLIDPRR